MGKNAIISKWEKLGLLDGLTGFINTAVASLFESRPQQIIFDNPSTYSTNYIISNVDIPEVNFSVSSMVINAEPRRLRAQWTPDIEQELQFYHHADGVLETFRELEEKKRIKKQRYKDRKMYIKMIEEWTGEKINTSTYAAPSKQRKSKSIKLSPKSPPR